MKNHLKRKIILSIGTIGTIMVPITAVISCSQVPFYAPRTLPVVSENYKSILQILYDAKYITNNHDSTDFVDTPNNLKMLVPKIYKNRNKKWKSDMIKNTPVPPKATVSLKIRKEYISNFIYKYFPLAISVHNINLDFFKLKKTENTLSLLHDQSHRLSNLVEFHGIWEDIKNFLNTKENNLMLHKDFALQNTQINGLNIFEPYERFSYMMILSMFIEVNSVLLSDTYSNKIKP